MNEGKYVLKLLPELGWGILFGIGAYLAQFAASTPANAIGEWKTYGLALGIGSLRIAGALALNFFKDLIAAGIK